MVRRSGGLLAVVFILIASAFSQTPESQPSAAKPLSPTARLAAAKTAYLRNGGGSEVPFNVIGDGIRSWGRYQIVNDPSQADIVIEVTAPAVGSGFSVSSTTGPDSRSNVPAESVTSSKEMTVTRITLMVYDAKSHMALWSSSEQPKSGMRAKTRNDNVVDAAQHLTTKFRERVEPEPR